MEILVLLVAFCASVVGAICGIGGGVIIKPLLDALGIADVATVSFLSGCTVLSMSCYSVVKALLAKESRVNFRTGTPLAIGAAFGGVLGKSLFSLLRDSADMPQYVGGYQSVCLAAITFATLLYTLNKSRVRTLHVQNTALCIVVGLFLGIFSAFLGIGGGPINLAVLYFFFSMETKEAAENSLYIILISQFTSLITSLTTASVPQFSLVWLILMVLGGILGGMVGRKLNKKITAAAVEKLFAMLSAVIVVISCCNAFKFFH